MPLQSRLLTEPFPLLSSLMFAPSPSPAFPPADALFKALGSVNYKLLAIKLVLLIISVAAFTVAVCSFAYKHARKFWLAHGEEIQLYVGLALEWLVKASKAAFNAAIAFRPVAARWANLAADWAFYRLAA
jgi:hypothetical protein